jgi:lysozyme
MDTSHYQGRPDLHAFKSAGGVFVIAKATQGVGYVDPEFQTTRADALAAALIFGTYHFSNWGDPVAEANYYLQHAGPRTGELVAFDAEGAIPAGVDVVAFADAWSRTVKAAVGVPPLIYMNRSWLTGHNWAPVVADNDGLWLAIYDGTEAQPASGAWPAVSFKQFTSTGKEPGVSGDVDVDAFFGSVAALEKFTIGGPTDMPLNSADVDLIWNKPVTRDDGQTGDVLKQVPAIQELANANTNAYDAKALAEQALAAVKALAAAPPPQPLAVDQTAADLIAKALVANPDFQAAVASAATVVVTQLDADLAKRFGPQTPPAGS